ncbi:hypothetical protein METUNv1_02674 [Methyloversatilis universalis FAM5]|jgi:hypothetical protein|uniref:F5/8 type C domain-containing protein n=2 Tax=Methyloversatilis universalis TaxID=378211 RepID=F5REF4_METUF|nr:hypothetical protein METUNv1_02674 [Methyloversatilis universalis FAM5]
MKSLMFAAALLFAGAVSAASPITAVNASATGTYSIDGPDLSILADGFIAPEGTHYTFRSVSWGGQEGRSGAVFTLDFGQLYTLTDVLLGVDNNDFYQVQVSVNGSSWNTLFTNLAFEGESSSGSEIISSDASHIQYQSTIDFPAVNARYARIYAVAGDGAYSVSEMSFSGVAVVPEPEAWALMLGGLALVGALSRRR